MTLDELKTWHVGQAEKANESAGYWLHLGEARVAAIGERFQKEKIAEGVAAAEFHVAAAKLIEAAEAGFGR